MNAFLRRTRPDPFLLILVCTTLLASLFPARGLPAVWLDLAATATITLLFFLHGLRLSRAAALRGMAHWQLHLTILAATFVIFPLIGLLLAAAMPDALPPSLWLGILFLCALPSTVQSSIAFTSIAGGNIAGAIAAATASNLVGIIITPLLFDVMTRTHGVSVPLSGVGKIVILLLLPFILGQLSRPWLGEWAARNRKMLMLTDRGTIILAVYSAFSAAVVAGLWHSVDLRTIVTLAGLCALILAIILGATRSMARIFGFSRQDEIAIIFCGSKKTLASGVPMARILFAGPAMGAAVLPLMIFHQMQLMVCAWLARRYAVKTLDHMKQPGLAEAEQGESYVRP